MQNLQKPETFFCNQILQVEERRQRWRCIQGVGLRGRGNYALASSAIQSKCNAVCLSWSVSTSEIISTEVQISPLKSSLDLVFVFYMILFSITRRVRYRKISRAILFYRWTTCKFKFILLHEIILLAKNCCFGHCIGLQETLITSSRSLFSWAFLVLSKHKTIANAFLLWKVTAGCCISGITRAEKHWVNMLCQQRWSKLLTFSPAVFSRLEAGMPCRRKRKLWTPDVKPRCTALLLWLQLAVGHVESYLR